MSSDEHIFRRIAAGDPSAVAECMDRYGALVWSLVRSRLSNAADAEDATQEIFIELWKSADRYDPALGSETVFISTITRRRLIDRLRAQGRRPVVEEFDENLLQDEGGGADPYLAPDVELAAKALESLEAGQREVLVMGVVQGMTHSEIALATGKPLGTVKTQLRRGLAKVRAMLESPGGARAAEGEE